MNKESDVIKKTLLLYENIEQLKRINTVNKQMVNSSDWKASMNEVIAFNEKLISIIEVYENILFGDIKELFDKGDQD